MPKKILSWGWLLFVPGGALWALTPLGIYLSVFKFKSPDVFWKLFPAAPLLLAAGLIGLYLWRDGEVGKLAKASLLLALAGFVLILAGDAGVFYLDLDASHIMTAPAYQTFRVGLEIFALGSALVGLTALRDRTLTAWGTLPFTILAFGGFVAVLRDQGPLGSTLWTAFGLGWAWLACAVLLDSFLSRNRTRERSA